jgi:peptide/nickel transport system ATP-binding protein
MEKLEDEMETKIEKDAHVIALNLKKYFPIKLGLIKSLMSRQTLYVRAVDGIDLAIKKGEVFGLVGESGCGKTTTGRVLLRLLEPTEGKILFDGIKLTELPANELRKMRKRMQIIFQDPYESLNPRMSIYDILAEPLEIQNITESSEETLDRVTRILEDMDMIPPEQFLYRLPHEISGGQKQRIAIARAFVIDPEFIVADEPISMLDASIRTEVMKLMLEMVQKAKVTFLFITHDVALTRYMCKRIAVMYLGKIVEMGPTEELIQQPIHPYMEALIAAVPVPDPTARRTEVIIKGEVPSPINPPPGCRFHPRCPYAKTKCKKEEPQLLKINGERYAACHFPLS